jgi:DNA-binding protein HU-beta
VNKADLVRELEKKLGSRKAATDALETVLDTIVREVSRGGKVAITGFGTFDRVDRAARTGRNPHTGTSVRIPKSKAPRFRPGTSFKAYVRRPSSLPTSAPARGRAAAGTASGAGTAKKSTTKRSTTKKSTAKKSTAKKAAGK